MNIETYVDQLGLHVITEEEELESIQKGIVHIYASWSGPSRLQTRLFLELIDELDLNQESIYFLYNELIQSKNNLRKFNTQGRGETFLLEKGLPIFQSKFGISRREFSQRLSSFF